MARPGRGGRARSRGLIPENALRYKDGHASSSRCAFRDHELTSWCGGVGKRCGRGRRQCSTLARCAPASRRQCTTAVVHRSSAQSHRGGRVSAGGFERPVGGARIASSALGASLGQPVEHDISRRTCLASVVGNGRDLLQHVGESAVLERIKPRSSPLSRYVLGDLPCGRSRRQMEVHLQGKERETGEGCGCVPPVHASRPAVRGQ
jgi:hypothetical protein